MKKTIILVFTLITTIIFMSKVIKAEEVYFPPASDSQVDEWGNWLKSSNLTTREEGAENLGGSKNVKAITYLLQALKDESATVRQISAHYIGNFGDNSIIPILIEDLKTESVENVQISIVESLIKLHIDENEIKPFLENFIDEGNIGVWLIKDLKNEKIREEMVEKMEVTAVKGKTPESKTFSAYALVRCFGKPVSLYSDAFTEAIASKNKNIKGYAIYGLKKIGNKAAKSALEKASKDEDKDVRKNAEEALRELKGK